MKAFPTHREEGMDLRDWFAGLAMQGIMSVPLDAWPISKDESPSVVAAKVAYLVSDAMMKEREIKEQ
jgi:hypothetical protein